MDYKVQLSYCIWFSIVLDTLWGENIYLKRDTLPITEPSQDVPSETLKGVSQFQCAHRCSLKRPKCKDFTYSQDEGHCILAIVGDDVIKDEPDKWNSWTIMVTNDGKNPKSPTERENATLNVYKSCNDVYEQDPQSQSDKYWIEYQSRPVMMDCDMQYGGGWTQIAHVETTDGQKLDIIDHTLTNPSQLTVKVSQSLPYLLDAGAIRKLATDIGATQLRVFCRKPSVGRTFHVVTRNTTLGRSVLEFFYDTTNIVLPTSTDSFDVMPDDSSFLAPRPSSWRTSTNKWGNGVYKDNTMKLYFITVYIDNDNAVGLKYTSDKSCDDVKSDSAGVWKYFIK